MCGAEARGRRTRANANARETPPEEARARANDDETATTTMAWTNFILTATGLLAVASLMRTDVRQSSRMLRQNLKTIRRWVEDGTSNAAKGAEKTLGETPAGKAMKELRDEALKKKD